MIKYPLITIDTDHYIRRMEPMVGDEAFRLIALMCPLTSRGCSYTCAFIGLSDSTKGMPGLVCKAFHGVIPLGYLDMDTLDLDKYEVLKLGSEIDERVKKNLEKEKDE